MDNEEEDYVKPTPNLKVKLIFSCCYYVSFAVYLGLYVFIIFPEARGIAMRTSYLHFLIAFSMNMVAR